MVNQSSSLSSTRLPVMPVIVNPPPMSERDSITSADGVSEITSSVARDPAKSLMMTSETPLISDLIRVLRSSSAWKLALVTCIIVEFTRAVHPSRIAVMSWSAVLSEARERAWLSLKGTSVVEAEAARTAAVRVLTALQSTSNTCTSRGAGYHAAFAAVRQTAFVSNTGLFAKLEGIPSWEELMHPAENSAAIVITTDRYLFKKAPFEEFGTDGIAESMQA